MSINTLLKMLCRLDRDSNTTSNVTQYGSFARNFTTLASNVPCYIYPYSFTNSSFNLDSVGVKIGNAFVGIFKSSQDIKVGDRVICTSFNSSIFYVRSDNILINARKGSSSHKEMLLEIERQ